MIRTLAILRIVVFATVVHVTRCALRLVRIGPPCGTILGESVVSTCERLGPAFVKLGQILSSRPDLLAPETGMVLAKLQDRVTPFDGKTAASVVSGEFGAPLEVLFAAFDPVPVASASIAQVHRARLHDGRMVAVKVRRPGIVDRVREDVRLMRRAAGALQRLPYLREVPLEPIMEQFGSAIEDQLDFRTEAENNRRFRRSFAAWENVRIPALVESLCTEAVITMEFVDGLQERISRGNGREEALKIGLRALYKMIFVDGFVHADMHPGNISFGAGPAFVMVDFGFTARLGGVAHKAFVDFFYGMVTNDGVLCASAVHATAAQIGPGFDYATFEGEMREAVARHSRRPAEAFEVTQFAYDMFAVQRRAQLLGSIGFVMTITALMVYEGIVKALAPMLDFQTEARYVLPFARAQLFPRRPWWSE